MASLIKVEESLSHTHNELLIESLKDAVSLCKDTALFAKLRKCLNMAVGLETYLERMCPPETPLMKKLLEDTEAEPWDEHFHNKLTLFPFHILMINDNTGAQFIKMILETAKAERVLEIGMFTGYTAAAVCSVDCVKQLTTLEIDPFVVNFVKSRFDGTEEGKKLRIIQGPALNSLQDLKKEGETFDLIFIDADKVNYINYYKFVMDNDLIGENGIILIDNTLWRGEMYPTPHGERGQLFYDFNEFVQNDPRVSQIILQIADGVSFIRRK